MCPKVAGLMSFLIVSIIIFVVIVVFNSPSSFSLLGHAIYLSETISFSLTLLFYCSKFVELFFFCCVSLNQNVLTFVIQL